MELFGLLLCIWMLWLLVRIPFGGGGGGRGGGRQRVTVRPRVRVRGGRMSTRERYPRFWWSSVGCLMLIVLPVLGLAGACGLWGLP